MAKLTDISLENIGWGVIPVGALLGVVLAAVSWIERGIDAELSFVLATVGGFAVIGGGAAGLLLAWSKIQNKFIAVPAILLGAIVLLLITIVCIGRLAEGR